MKRKGTADPSPRFSKIKKQWVFTPHKPDPARPIDVKALDNLVSIGKVQRELTVVTEETSIPTPIRASGITVFILFLIVAIAAVVVGDTAPVADPTLVDTLSTCSDPEFDCS